MTRYPLTEHLRGATVPLPNTARAHLEAGHQVSAWWKVDQRGDLYASPEGLIEIGDTELGDALETDEVRCQTCDKVLDLTPDIP